MALNSNLPFLTPETSFFTCFGVDTASPLAHEWLGSKVGLVKNQKFLSQNFKLLKVTFCPQIDLIYCISCFPFARGGGLHMRGLF